jgi:hypothetical protein
MSWTRSRLSARWVMRGSKPATEATMRITYALRRLTAAAFGTLMCLAPALALAVGLALLGQVPGTLAG